MFSSGGTHARGGQDEMGEARAVMRTLKEERDEIRSHLDGMQVGVVCVWVGFTRMSLSISCSVHLVAWSISLF